MQGVGPPLHPDLIVLASRVWHTIAGMSGSANDTIEVRSAAAPEAPVVVEVLVEAAAWLLARGIRQWEANVTDRVRLEEIVSRWVAQGKMYVGVQAGGIMGVFLLASLEPWMAGIWPDDPPGTLYLGKLAIRRAFGGRGLGLKLLQQAEAVAAGLNARRVRLDCWAENLALISYYSRAGYEPQGIVEAHGWKLARFEKLLVSSA